MPEEWFVQVEGRIRAGPRADLDAFLAALVRLEGSIAYFQQNRCTKLRHCWLITWCTNPVTNLPLALTLALKGCITLLPLTMPQLHNLSAIRALHALTACATPHAFVAHVSALAQLRRMVVAADAMRRATGLRHDALQVRVMHIARILIL